MRVSSLHWVMDMTLRDDECRVRNQNAPENFVTLKQMAANMRAQGAGTRFNTTSPQNRSVG